MRRTIYLFATLMFLPLSAFAAIAPTQILNANRAATGGTAWSGKRTFALDFAYSGQGLTGTMSTIADLRSGAFVDTYAIGPQTGASGYDGAKAWEKEPSGTITDQAGGDVIPLAVTESYQDRNLWWRADRGGAVIESLGRKTEKGETFDILKVTPNGGATLEVWFAAKSHLIARTIELQGTQTITTFYLDYKPVDGVAIARKLVVDDGSGNPQTSTLTRARFLGSQPASAFAKPVERLSDYTIAGGATETTVPFELLNNHIYAGVSINGAAPSTFIFDTGGHTILTPATAKALKIGAAGNQTMSGGGEGTAQSGVGTVKSLTVGGVTLTNQPITVLTFSPPGVEGIDEAGMLGYEFLDRFVTRIDYGAHTLTFIDKAHFDPKDAGTPVPIHFYHQFPEVLGSYDGIPARFGIDTGARMTLMLTGPFAHDHDIHPVDGVDAMMGWGVGGASFGHVFRGRTLTLGDVTIDHPLTSVSTDKGGAGASPAFPNNVGGGILKRFIVTLDYDHSTMYLKPIAAPVADVDTFDRSGLWINDDKDGFKIIDVTKGSPAEQAGLLKGDIITAVDGKPAASLKLYDVRQRFRDDAPGTAVKFSVKQGTATKDVYVILRDLI